MMKMTMITFFLFTSLAAHASNFSQFFGGGAQQRGGINEAVIRYDQDWIVPVGVTSITITAIGGGGGGGHSGGSGGASCVRSGATLLLSASGGSNNGATSVSGGGGAVQTQVFTVTPGQRLTVAVGGGGGVGASYNGYGAAICGSSTGYKDGNEYHAGSGAHGRGYYKSDTNCLHPPGKSGSDVVLVICNGSNPASGNIFIPAGSGGSAGTYAGGGGGGKVMINW